MEILNVVRIAITAWALEIKAKTIQNCFCYCKIKTDDTSITLNNQEIDINTEIRAELKQ